jgi:hypothetical protein
MSGALAVVNSQSVTTLGQDFGTLNGFSSNVSMTQGNWCLPVAGAGTFVAGACSGVGVTAVPAVQAVVTQCLPQTLSNLLYTGSCNGTSGNVTVRVRAIASINTPVMKPCALALNGPVTFQDAATQVNAPNCTIASNNTSTANGFHFQVAPSTLNVGSMSTSGSCTGIASLCNSVATYQTTISDPFSALKTAMTTPSNLTMPNCSGSTLTPYTASTPCANKNSVNGPITIAGGGFAGVYFFNGLNLTGSNTIWTCAASDPSPLCTNGSTPVTATIILLPGTSFKMTGNSVMTITAPNTTTGPPNSSLPSQLQSSSCSSCPGLLADMAIFFLDASPQTGGTTSLTWNGVLYAPNASFNTKGTSNSTVPTCTELIAATITFAGTSSFGNSGCPISVIPKSQVVALVQ